MCMVKLLSTICIHSPGYFHFHVWSQLLVLFCLGCACLQNSQCGEISSNTEYSVGLQSEEIFFLVFVVIN